MPGSPQVPILMVAYGVCPNWGQVCKGACGKLMLPSKAEKLKIKEMVRFGLIVGYPCSDWSCPSPWAGAWLGALGEVCQIWGEGCRWQAQFVSSLCCPRTCWAGLIAGLRKQHQQMLLMWDWHYPQHTLSMERENHRWHNFLKPLCQSLLKQNLPCLFVLILLSCY